MVALLVQDGREVVMVGHQWPTLSSANHRRLGKEALEHADLLFLKSCLEKALILQGKNSNGDE